jgi:hypothetical protein
MKRSLAICSLTLLLSACPPSDPHVDIGMTDTTFVKTMVGLYRVATDSSIDSTARDSARRQVLRLNKVTTEQLDAASKALALEPVRANSLWARIDRQSVHRNAAKP